ncbi:MAG: hemin uptake protein HemP [Gammaproteobacteria bacterium]|nr:hemin uptake protein HemP [Gammaproteobacteria bacterium]
MSEPLIEPLTMPSAKPGLMSPRRFDSSALFQNTQEVVIVHAGQEYRLRITRFDKLILTK